MLVLYTLGYLVVFTTVFLVTALPPQTVAGSWTSLESWAWFLLWWLLYILGYLLVRLVVVRGGAWIADVAQPQWRARLERLEGILRPPLAPWLDIAIVCILLALVVVLPFINQGTLWLGFVLSVVALVYGNIIFDNWRRSRLPGPVIELVAEPGPGAHQASLRWQNPPHTAFSGVLVQRSPDPPQDDGYGVQVYRGFMEEWRDETLEPGRTYYHTVTSLGPGGRSGGRITAQVQTYPLPPDPTDIRVVAGTHEIELHWQLPPSPFFREIVVQRRQDRFPESERDGQRIYQGAGTRCQDFGLQLATLYYYRLYCMDQYGQASAGATIEVPTRAPDVSNLRIGLERGRVRLSWVTPLEPMPEVVIVRKVGADPESRNDGDGVVYQGRDTAWTDDNTLPATDYHYRVYACYPRAVYSDGLCVHITTPPPPSAIQDFTAFPGRNRIQLQWRRPVARPFAGVLILRTLDRPAGSPDEENTSFVYEGAEREQILDAGLEPGTLYFYTAFTYDEAGRYGTPRSISSRTLPGPQPVQFHPPLIDETAREVVLNWTRGDPVAPQVHLRRWEGQPPDSLSHREPGGNLLYQGPGMQYVDRNLLTNHTYYYVVYALDDEGCASVGVSQQVQTPEDWNVQVFIHFQAVGEAESYSLPESTRIDVWVPELLRITGQPPGANFRLFNLTRNYEYRLDSSLRDQDTRTGDELLLTYDLEPNEGLAPNAGQGDNP